MISRQSQSKPNERLSTNKKTGIVISKCFHMLCGACGKRFSSKFMPLYLEIMLLELTGSNEDRDQSVFDTQAYFNSVQSKRVFLCRPRVRMSFLFFACANYFKRIAADRWSLSIRLLPSHWQSCKAYAVIAFIKYRAGRLARATTSLHQILATQKFCDKARKGTDRWWDASSRIERDETSL